MNITRSTATRTLDGLQKLGYIKRIANTEDGRELQIQPTAKAVRIKEELNNASGEVTKKFKKLLGSDVFERVVGEVRSVSEVI